MAIEIDLSGRVALVTGGSRGLGRADALALARAGADVVIADIQVESDESTETAESYGVLAQVAKAQGIVYTEATAKEIQALGRRSAAIKCDVTDRDQVKETVDRVVEEFGSVDILINNAGTLDHVGQFHDQNPELWERDLRVNLTGGFNCAQAVWPHMKEREWGRIINMASVAGTLGGFGQASYSTTKAGILGLTRTLAMEGGRHGITCNAIVPGIIGTEAFHFANPAMNERIANRTVFKRPGEPEDIANAICFLCSDLAELHHRRRPAGERWRRAVCLLAQDEHPLSRTLIARRPLKGAARGRERREDMNVGVAHGIGFELSAEQRELQRPRARVRRARAAADRARVGRARGLPARAARQGGGARPDLARDPGRVRRRRRRRGDLEPDRRGALVGLRRPGRADRGDDVPGAAAAALGHGGAEAALAAAARLGGGLPRRDRVHRARRRLRRRRRSRPTARRDGDEYVLNGEKCYVTNGGIAELTIVFAKLDGAITAFLVEAGDPGVSAGRKEPKLGLRSSYTGSILFDEARHPGRPAARRGGRGLRDRDGLLHALAAAGGGLGGRDRARGVRVRDRLRERAACVRQAAAREAGRLLQARRHGDAGRGVAAARLARGGGARRGRGRRPARLLREGASPPTRR